MANEQLKKNILNAYVEHREDVGSFFKQIDVIFGSMESVTSPRLIPTDRPKFDPIDIQKKILIAGILNHPCVLDELHKGLSDVFEDALSEDIYKHASCVRPDASKEDALNGCAETIEHLINLKRMSKASNDMEDKHKKPLSPLLKAMMKRGLYND